MTERHPREDRHTLSEYLLFSEIFSRRLEKQSGLCPGQRSVNAKLQISLRIYTVCITLSDCEWD